MLNRYSQVYFGLHYKRIFNFLLPCSCTFKDLAKDVLDILNHYSYDASAAQQSGDKNALFTTINSGIQENTVRLIMDMFPR